MKKICDDFSQFLIKGSNPWLISTASRSQFSPLHYRPLGVPCFVDDSQETQTHNAMQYNFIARWQKHKKYALVPDRLALFTPLQLQVWDHILQQ